MPGFEAPSIDERNRWLDRIGEPSAHAEIVRDLPCLQTVDVDAAAMAADATRWLRVAAWNIERGRDPAAIAELIRRTNADVALLTEVDVGMARTNNRDVARELANQLSAGSAFAVEFVELGLGTKSELETITESENRCGLHGNAIVSKVRMLDPDVVRMSLDGSWFTHERGEPRVGGRCAIVGTVVLDEVEIDVVAVHFESESDPASRAVEMRTLVDALDARGPRPAVIGGDLNTFSAGLMELADRADVSRLRAADPTRFSWPVAYEPLFDVAAEHGFEWVDANLAAPTTRHGADGLPDHVAIKIDWFLVRGLEARRPTVVAAIAPDGSELSNHELLALSVRLAP